MSTSNKWAAIVGLILVLLVGGGVATWRHAHPDLTPVALLDEPRPPSATSPETTKPSATIPDAAVTPTPQRSPLPSTPPASQTVASATPAPSPQPPAPQAKAAPAPTFDVVRVEPAGDAVVAGKGEPNAAVALLGSGKVLAQAKADASGQFVLLPPPLAPGDYDLAIRQTPAGQEASTSSQTVAVSVPKSPKGQVVVALAEPGRPTRVLSAPPPAAPSEAPAKPVAAPKLAIGSVDLENGNGFYATGTAAPGADVHVYLNDSRVADVVAGKDGRWSLTIRKGLSGGHYAVRADAGPAGKPVARAEVPFDVPRAMASANIVSPADSRVPPHVGRAGSGAPSQTAEAPAAIPTEAPTSLAEAASQPANEPVGEAGRAPPPDAAHAVIERVITHAVLGGDNLWRISRQDLGEGHRYTQIYEANADQIRDPNKIYPGQILVVPPK